jgi:hypothetical protein
VHTGGYRATTAISDCHIARQVLQSASVLIADYVFLPTVPIVWLAAPRSSIPDALPSYTIGFTAFHPIAARYFLVLALSAVGKCVTPGIVIAEGGHLIVMFRWKARSSPITSDENL